MSDYNWSPPENWDPFVYRARVRHLYDEEEAVIDGDTIWFQRDKGDFDFSFDPIRLLTVDTREISFVSHDSIEYERGIVHKDWVDQWLHEATEEWSGQWPFIIKTYLGEQEGKYGRVLGQVWARTDSKEKDLGTALLDEFDDVEVYD